MSLCSDGLSNDQYFLVNFIMSNYLGPDVYSDNPRCSSFRRLAKGLPPYTLKHIGSSSLTVAQLQNLYCYVLRKAEPSVVLHPDMVYMYIKGCLPLESVGMFPQFTYFFPTNLHPQKRYSPSHEIVKGIVVVDDPEVEFIRKEELQRFRCLSRLNDLKIDRVLCLSPRRVQLDESRKTEDDCSRNGEVISNGPVTNHEFNSSGEIEGKCRRKNEEERVAAPAVCGVSKIVEGISQSKGTEHDCLRNGEVMSNGLLTNQNVDAFEVLQKKCERKNEEEAVVGFAVCVESKSQEGISGDVPQSRRMEQDSSENEEVIPNGVLTNQNLDSSEVLQETCKRKSEEEVVARPAVCVISKPQEGIARDTSQSEETENGCLRNGEVATNVLVSVEEFNSSAEVRETCRRKKEEEEAVGDLAICVVSETQEGISGDMLQIRETEHDCSRNGEVTSNGLELNSSAEVRETCKRKKEEEEEEAVAGHAVCGASKTPERFRETYKRKRFKNSSTKAKDKNGKTDVERDETDKSITLKLVPFPPDTKEKCETEPTVVTTGTASKRTTGSPIGVVDIGINKVAYFFQVALPGVRRDYGEFSCEVESDGKVVLEGSSTTGEKTIRRHSRVFEMNIQKLCPPGPFKLSFSLPGPVDPRLFSPNFRSDGIFEAVIIRTQES